MYPNGHKEHVDAPTSLYVKPCATVEHAVHAACPVVDVNVPAGHGIAMPVAGQYDPIGQVVHVLAKENRLVAPSE